MTDINNLSDSCEVERKKCSDSGDGDEDDGDEHEEDVSLLIEHDV